MFSRVVVSRVFLCRRGGGDGLYLCFFSFIVAVLACVWPSTGFSDIIFLCSLHCDFLSFFTAVCVLVSNSTGTEGIPKKKKNYGVSILHANITKIF